MSEIQDHARLFVLAATVLLAGYCYAQPTQKPTEASLAFFEKRVRPLLVRHCYACHSHQSQKSEGGLLLDSRRGLLVGGDRGSAIVPAKPDRSLLILAVRYADEDLQMPPDKKLSEEQLRILEQWVKMGAPDPREEKKRGKKWTNPADPVAGRKHWAFQPISKSSLPKVVGNDWPLQPLDRFVLAKLEKRQLTPQRDADRTTWLRRVYVQLVGILPTPDEVRRFNKDSRPDAYSRVVDRLLQTPQFGERWGRHWLDLARYADSNGLDENFLFREAWRYRNRVIDCFCEDKPFDEFVREQIAGDLMPYDTEQQRDRQRISAGFLVIGPKVLLGVNREKQKLEVADEQLDTIGRTFLGQTIGCARCHDHKFDPIPTADYYAMAGIFTSTRVMETRYMLGAQRRMEQLIGLGKNGHQLDSQYETYWRSKSKWTQQLKAARQALALLKKGDEKAITALLKKNPQSLAKLPGGTPLDKRQAAQQSLVNALTRKLSKVPAIPPRAMVPSEVDLPADEHIRLAGQFTRKGRKVKRGALQVISDKRLTIAGKTSGRKELADWLVNVESGAGRLTARVLANRIWQHMIGRGIVATADNFGRTGSVPSHPKLLDYLANRLIQQDWSIKHLVREIALSRTFAMSSQFKEKAHQIDPDNHLLWRANRRRLDPETLRDSILQCAAALDLSRLNSSVSYLGDQATAVGANKNRRRTDFPNRSIYLPVIRNDLPELFEVFNFADPHATTGKRSETTVATQGLYLLNSKEILELSDKTAKRIVNDASSDSARVSRAFAIILNAKPTAAERQGALRLVRNMQRELRNTQAKHADHRAWSVLCQSLFASTRFQILE